MRSRLTLLLAATAAAVLLALVVPLALLVRATAAERAVAAADTQLRALVPVVTTGTAEAVNLAVAGADRPITVFLPDGRAVGAAAPVTAAVRLGQLGRSRTVDSAAGREIVVAAGTPAGTAVLRTVVPPAELNRGVPRTWLLLGLLAAALIALAVAAADRFARALARPLTAVSAAAHRLAGGDLDARATPAGPPEVREVATALNHLAERIRDLLARERERVADLSHRLRTPLTALRLEAESAVPAGPRLTALVDDLERAVTGVIQQARRRSAAPGRCDAAAVVADRVDFWTALADETGRPVRRDLAPGPLPVAAAADALAAALDALLGNVFAHTPDGAGFTVTLNRPPGGGAAITVADEGPGLAAAALARGVSGGASTGLGLDIARQVAEAGRGTLVVDRAAGGGAAITLTLSAPAP
ncbi:two-component sensor histidine kinase [Pilimelia anulata]|uniref:histidine kinase n=1 Tax=Pilimelia anulata TaxID=53371 RepID=A0A8J3B971_9ACTN|nr:HAMP domain-containing sensor histidine kinase [Pilimelia anulata]GGJ88440.1 two-component sensor histidine kinase [Pilimelia anulata]